MNRYLAGTLMPRIQLDFIPGLACAGHFVLLAKHRAENIDDFVSAGHAVQRFWLTATRLGLFIQPEMTPLIFHDYVSNSIRFSSTKGMDERARKISGHLKRLIGEEDAEMAVFMGRIGYGPTPVARSVRLPLARLLMSELKPSEIG